MHIKCEYNRVIDLPKKMIESPRLGFKESMKFDIILEKFYIVYAVGVFEEFPWFCINDEVHDRIPYWIPAALFNVEDSRLSRFWRANIDYANKKKKFTLIVSIPEWAHEEYFYGNMIEYDGRELDIFLSYKKKMDLEFPDPNIQIHASLVEDENQEAFAGYIQCPLCCSIWAPSTDFAMVHCDDCGTLMHSPLVR